MTQTEKRYLQLLRQGLWDGDSTHHAAIGMDEFLLARKHATSGVISRFAERAEFQNEITFLKIQRLTHIAALSEIKSRLDSASIPFVLLKGLGVESNYPEPGLRSMGDIDIYVREDDYSRAAALFGCAIEASDERKHFSTVVGSVTLEVHRRCEDMPSRRADRHFKALAEKGLSAGLCPLDIDGVEVNAPCDNFNAIYLFAHFFNHFLGGGCGLRQICDWALFLHAKREDIDRKYIAAALKSLCLTNAWKVFGAMAVRHLGLPQDEMPLYDPSLSAQGDRLIRIILDMGNFGASRKIARIERFGRSFIGSKLGSLIGAFKHSTEMLSLFPIHSLRYFLNTITSSTSRSLRQIFSRR